MHLFSYKWLEFIFLCGREHSTVCPGALGHLNSWMSRLWSFPRLLGRHGFRCFPGAETQSEHELGHRRPETDGGAGGGWEGRLACAVVHPGPVCLLTQVPVHCSVDLPFFWYFLFHCCYHLLFYTQCFLQFFLVQVIEWVLLLKVVCLFLFFKIFLWC